MAKVFRRIRTVLLGIAASLVALVLFGVTFLALADGAADDSARVVPSYAKEDLAPVLEKELWTEEDYDFLYHQTGLGKVALDDLKGQNDRILAFQEALFYRGELEHISAGPITWHDALKGYEAPIAPLENGDVLVTSTCHTLGWRNGHSALVVDGRFGLVLQCVGPGTLSGIDKPDFFLSSANFLVLRLKDATKEERAEIAFYAEDHLNGIDYSVLTGFFSSPKDQGEEPKTTHCSHLVWQAYYYFGIDIDPDGGPVCSSRDIAECPYFEVVQAYGFDLDKLW